MENIYLGKQSKYSEKNKEWGSYNSAWKAGEIVKIIRRHTINANNIVEIGCGAGEVLYQLNNKINDDTVIFEGYDISEYAINIANQKTVKNVKFYNKDFLITKKNNYDLLLMIDVFEHVPDYLNFIEENAKRAIFKIYHIPLDMTVSAILRDQFSTVRKSVGHLHYFTKETALETLKDTGQEIIDYFYTAGSFESRQKLRTRIANIPRILIYPLMPNMTVKLIGGYSLMILTK